ncbi:MAG: cytochrome c oxidase subunit II [Spirochaetes bacterium]|nr:cytochrome c oxidase subunit II [Spirochaetota bacterium]
MAPPLVTNESLMHLGDLWFPTLAEKAMGGVDLLYWGIFWVSVGLGAAIFGVAVYLGMKYRRGSAAARPESEHQGMAMEVAWTVIPLVLVLSVFVWSFLDHLRSVVPPADAYEVRVLGKKWFWQFEYPQAGVTAINDLVVPVNRNIKLNMSSEDVIHSFFLPNFRRKKDVLPNRTTSLWFHADREGKYQIFCAEYCGDGHSVMLGNLLVVSQEAFDQYLAKASATSDEPLPQLGKKLYQSKACFTCHTVDGSAGTGPSLLGLYGKKRRFADGSSLDADENYLRESLLVPAARVVQGFQPVMPTYQGLLKEREITAMIEYLKGLK